MSKSVRLAVPFLLIFGGLAGLVAMGVAQGGVPEAQVHQIVAGEFPDREVKVHGFLAAIESAERPLRFSVVDKENPELRIPVVCDRTRPDTFQETYDVAVQGRWDPEAKHFVADQIFSKCPSKYEAESKAGQTMPQLASDVGVGQPE